MVYVFVILILVEKIAKSIYQQVVYLIPNATMVNVSIINVPVILVLQEHFVTTKYVNHNLIVMYVIYVILQHTYVMEDVQEE